MNRAWLLGLACLLCCLPLIAPVFAAAGLTGLGGWLGGLDMTEIACIALIIGALAGASIFHLRRRRLRQPYCDVKD